MYSYRNGKKVELEVDNSKVVIRSHPKQMETLGLVVEEELSSASMTIRQSTDSDFDGIKKASDIFPVYPFLMDLESKTPFLITDRIIGTSEQVHPGLVQRPQTKSMTFSLLTKSMA